MNIKPCPVCGKPPEITIGAEGRTAPCENKHRPQTEMKTTPLLFRAEMIRAILQNRKTQTRRLVKPQPKGDLLWADRDNGFDSYAIDLGDGGGGSGHSPILPPLGQPGDKIWVRETWALRGSAADMTAKEIRETTHKDILRDDLVYRADSDGYDAASQGWRPSIFMPRWASRITLALTAVRVERLCQISADDATAEGCGMGTNEQGGPVARYFHLWESINGKGSWTQNPWVFVYSFKKL